MNATIYFDPTKYPSVIQKIETNSVNSITDFSVTFLSILTVEFAKIGFKAGTDSHSQLDVAVRNVKFDGPLAFVQKLQELLGNLGDGFKLELSPQGLMISYTSPPLGISTPTFTFTNISIGVILQIYFSRKPLDVTFTVGTPENKVTVAAVFLGGCFFLGMTVNPKTGMSALEMALEMGAYLGISLGPISGSVKFMVGIYIKKTNDDCILEGYFIAEGTLSVWILSVSARLFMYIKSDNSSVVGGCTVSYKVKVGFFSATFSGSFEKRIAGATTSSPSQSAGNAPAPEGGMHAMAQRSTFSAAIQPSLQRAAVSTEALTATPDTLTATPDTEFDDAVAMLNALDQDVYQLMNQDEWEQFYNLFYQ